MFYIFLLVLSTVIPLVLVVVYMIFFLILPMVRGAVYVPSDRSRIDIMIRLLDIKPGDRAIDIGSGDGRLVIEMAKKGAEAHGIEINPLLVLWSRRKINKMGLQSQARVSWKNQWNQNFESFNKVSVYGIKYIMKDLEKKLNRELKQGSLVVSNAFSFPSWPPVKEEGEKNGVIRLYRKD